MCVSNVLCMFVCVCMLCTVLVVFLFVCSNTFFMFYRFYELRHTYTRSYTHIFTCSIVFYERLAGSKSTEKHFSRGTVVKRFIEKSCSLSFSKPFSARRSYVFIHITTTEYNTRRIRK